MKRFLALVLLAPVAALAIGLHDEPVDTRVGATFQLGNKRIPLAEIKDGRLTRAVQAWGNVDPGQHRRWRQEVDPCKPRENVLARRDLSQNDENQFCFDVQEIRGYMKKSTGWRMNAQQWLGENRIAVPPNVLFDAAQLGADPAQRVQAALRWAEENVDAVRKGLATPGP